MTNIFFLLNAGLHFLLFQQCFQPTLLFTIQSRLLTTIRERPFENIVEKKENAGNQHFLLFPQCFSSLHKTNFTFGFILNLPSANAFNLSSERFCRLALVLTCLRHKSFENTVGKGEIANNEQFLLLPQSFLLILRTFYHFYQIENCRLQTISVLKSLKFFLWEKVNCSQQKLSTWTTL